MAESRLANTYALMYPLHRFRHPLAPLIGPSAGSVLTAMILLTAGVMLALGQASRALTAGGECPGILEFEFAFTLERSQQIISCWLQHTDGLTQVSLLSTAAFGLGFDYLFLALYGTTLALVCLWAAARHDSLAAARWGDRFAWAALTAAAADALENFCLYQLVLGGFSPAWPILAGLAAALKFALIAACLLYLVVSFVAGPRASTAA